MGSLRAEASVAGGTDIFKEGGVTAGRPVPIIETLGDAHSVTGEELRLLRAKLRAFAQSKGVKCIGLSSALPGEGKSTIALGAAAALARDAGARVLLVEADLRRPSISGTLGIEPAPGLAEWLNGGIERAAIRVVQPGGFRLMVAGRAPLERPESVGSERMESLLRAARASFDFVLIDGPPILAVSDTILMQDLVDGLLLVARSRQTPREAMVEALGRLRGDKVLGVVLNDHQEYRHSYKSYAYGRYGMGDSGKPGRPRRRP